MTHCALWFRRGAAGFLMAAVFAAPAPAFSLESARTLQGPLTLERAIELARVNNGDLRAALKDVEVAGSRVRQSFGTFLPTVTPIYRYDSTRDQVFTGPLESRRESNQSTVALSASWRLLDSGARELSYRANRRDLDAQRFAALSTVRNTLFEVYQSFYNALRAQELQRVADLQVERSEKILDQTRTSIRVGATAPIEERQALADRLNAEVSQLSAGSRTQNALADLRAVIAWPREEPFPALEDVKPPAQFEDPEPLEVLSARGMSQRTDLQQRRVGLEAQRFDVERRRRDTLVTFTLDADYSRSFHRGVNDSTGLTFLAQVPLFDGRQTRELLNQARLTLKAGEERLRQAERNAQADIEASRSTLVTDIRRIRAAGAALEAARANFTAATDAQRLGAQGTSVITVLTAQITLVNAETNYVEALYDTLISLVRLKLAVGDRLPGEVLTP